MAVVSPAAFLYTLIGLLMLAAGIGVPWLIHESGSTAVPGWQGLVNPGPLSAKHQSIAERCEACHTPHVGIEAKNCVGCHATAPFQAKPSAAFHFTIQDCRGCHVEHEGGSRPTRMDHVVLAAAGFHQTLQERAEQPPEARLAEWLGDLDLVADHRRETAHLDCAACHANKDPHQGLFGRECAACHGVTSWTIAEYRHPSPSSTDCAQCHQAPPSHYMGHFHMVSQKVAGQEHARVEQCYLCHTTDAWNNIKGVGWYKHH